MKIRKQRYEFYSDMAKAWIRVINSCIDNDSKQFAIEQANHCMIMAKLNSIF